jgi:hypothetical protein
MARWIRGDFGEVAQKLVVKPDARYKDYLQKRTMQPRWSFRGEAVVNGAGDCAQRLEEELEEAQPAHCAEVKFEDIRVAPLQVDLPLPRLYLRGVLLFREEPYCDGVATDRLHEGDCEKHYSTRPRSQGEPC